jgi:hypothetical protein
MAYAPSSKLATWPKQTCYSIDHHCSQSTNNTIDQLRRKLPRDQVLASYKLTLVNAHMTESLLDGGIMSFCGADLINHRKLII